MAQAPPPAASAITTARITFHVRERAGASPPRVRNAGTSGRGGGVISVRSGSRSPWFIDVVSVGGDEFVFFDDVGREVVAVDTACIETDGARAAPRLG